jgi:ribonuclease HI
VLISPQGRKYEFSLSIVATSTNNQAEYQALIKGLELLREIRADDVKIFGDSMLVINQLARIYECRSELLISYHERCLQLLKEFKDFCLEHISRLHNEEANRLAQHALGYQPIQEVLTSAVDINDWRKEIVDYLRDPSKKVERRIRFQATKYVLLDDELYYQTIDGVLLRCLSGDESKSLMGEIHEGVCGAHQSAFKMKWMIRRNGYYWPTILEDCFKYFKGCQGC